MTRLPTILTCSIALALVCGCGDPAPGGGSGSDGGGGGERQYITIGTATTGGVFSQIGAGIRNAVEIGASNLNWKVATEGTKGSMQNIRSLDAGKLEFGMANSAITYFAVRGEEGWDKEYAVRHVMTLAPNIAQFVTLEKSGIKSIADFKGKRVVVGPAGAGFEYFIRPILKAHGVSYEDFTPLNNNFNGAADMLKNGDADVAFMGGAVPVPAVVSAASTHKVAFVPFDPAAVAKLAEQYPFFRATPVPADKYSFLEADFQAISCGEMQLVCASALPEQTVHDFTKALWEQRAEVVKSHPAGRAINEKNAARDVGTPFHPGAAKFYGEIGIK